MRIGIDASNLRHGGGRTHLVELLEHGEAHLGPIDQVVVWGSAETLSKLPTRRWIDPRHETMLDGSLAQRLLWQRTHLMRRARDVSLLFAPGGVTTPFIRPRVVMSRNLLPFDSAERARYGLSPTRLRLEMLRLGQARSFASADAVIFLNEYARSHVTAAMPRAPRRVAVIPHGVADRFREKPRPARRREEITSAAPLQVLYVSSIAPYKHQRTVIDAVARLRGHVDIELTLIGGTDGSNYVHTVRHAISEAQKAGVRVNYLGPMSFGELHRAYSSAEVFVFASSCENMPNILLEAMSNGLPIACASRGPMPEMLGDAGVYFDPERSDEIGSALRMLADDPSLRRRNAELAATRSEAFSWVRCARETFSFLSDVARDSKQ